MSPFRELSQEEMKKISDKVGNARCRFCNERLRVWKYVSAMPYLSPENQMYIDAGDKLVSLVCPNCGSISLFNESAILR